MSTDNFYIIIISLVLGIISSSPIHGQATINTCPNERGDLTEHVLSSPPTGTTVTWHFGSPASDDNKVSDPTDVQPGVYYAAFFDTLALCYSPVSSPKYIAACAKNTCPNTTVNLNNHVSSIPPEGTVISWHTGCPASIDNRLDDVTQVGSGTYFVSYFDADNGCFSPCSPVHVTIEGCTTTEPIIVHNTCPATSVDLADHVTSPAPQGTTITWHSACPATQQNMLSDNATSAVGEGIYYAAFFDADNGCFSPCSQGIQVVIEECCTIEVTVNSPQGAICQGESIQLIATTNISQEDITYHWTPSLGLSCTDCPNPIASPSTSINYQVTASYADCSDIAFVQIQTGVFPNVSAHIEDMDCCEGGSINLTSLHLDDDWTYTWTPNVSSTSFAENLDPGIYEVLIETEDGCSKNYSFSIADNCSCPDYIEADTIYATVGEQLEICTSVDYALFSIYDVILDGSSYSPSLNFCETDSVIFYTYALLVNQGNSGPYRIDSWVCSQGQVHSGVAQDMDELVALMQTWDPEGNWVHNPSTFTISGGDPYGGYMDMNIVHIPSGVFATMMINYTGIGTNTAISYTATDPGTHIFEVEGPQCCEDAVVIIVEDPCANFGISTSGDAFICEGASTTLSASGGISYSWTPTQSLDDPSSANPVAAPTSNTTYTVVATNADGCTTEESITVIVAPEFGIEIVDLQATDCCVGGAATVQIFGDADAVSYLWDSQASNSNSSTNLSAGQHTVEVTNELGCTNSLSFIVPDGCTDCEDIFTQETVYFSYGQDASVCVPIPFLEQDLYNIILDGTDYTQAVELCSIDSVIFYTYALLAEEGDAGPYLLESWQCNNVYVENIEFQDMAELVSIMNQYDPSGNWVLNANTYTISGGADNLDYVYGNIHVTHLSTGIMYTIMTNHTGFAQGFEVDIPDGVGTYTLEIEHSIDCCVDEIQVVVQPALESQHDTEIKGEEPQILSDETVKEEKVLSVYPNPFSDKLYVDLDASKFLEYQLIDIYGRIINQGTVTNNSIDNLSMPSGTYLLKVFDRLDGKEYQTKIIKIN